MPPKDKAEWCKYCRTISLDIVYVQQRRHTAVPEFLGLSFLMLESRNLCCAVPLQPPIILRITLHSFPRPRFIEFMEVLSVSDRFIYIVSQCPQLWELQANFLLSRHSLYSQNFPSCSLSLVLNGFFLSTPGFIHQVLFFLVRPCDSHDMSSAGGCSMQTGETVSDSNSDNVSLHWESLSDAADIADSHFNALRSDRTVHLLLPK